MSSSCDDRLNRAGAAKFLPPPSLFDRGVIVNRPTMRLASIGRASSAFRESSSFQRGRALHDFPHYRVGVHGDAHCGLFALANVLPQGEAFTLPFLHCREHFWTRGSLGDLARWFGGVADHATAMWWAAGYALAHAVWFLATVVAGEKAWDSFGRHLIERSRPRESRFQTYPAQSGNDLPERHRIPPTHTAEPSWGPHAWRVGLITSRRRGRRQGSVTASGTAFVGSRRWRPMSGMTPWPTVPPSGLTLAVTRIASSPASPSLLPRPVSAPSA